MGFDTTLQCCCVLTKSSIEAKLKLCVRTGFVCAGLRLRFPAVFTHNVSGPLDAMQHQSLESLLLLGAYI